MPKIVGGAATQSVLIVNEEETEVVWQAKAGLDPEIQTYLFEEVAPAILDAFGDMAEESSGAAFAAPFSIAATIVKNQALFDRALRGATKTGDALRGGAVLCEFGSAIAAALGQPTAKGWLSLGSDVFMAIAEFNEDYTAVELPLQEAHLTSLATAADKMAVTLDMRSQTEAK